MRVRILTVIALSMLMLSSALGQSVTTEIPFHLQTYFGSVLPQNQTPPKSVAVTPPATGTVKMPEARSNELKALQEQATRLEAALREIQLRAAAIVSRAALEARLTVEQLDSMDLVADEKGDYTWRPKPPAAKKETPE